MSTAILDAASACLVRGRPPIPVRGKRPIGDGWQNLRLTQDDLPRRFTPGINLGVLLGDPAGGMVDADLDMGEAIRLAHMLPATGSRFGRQGKPNSHHLFIAHPVPATKQFEAPDGGMVLEIRSTGAQTVFPPSVHDPSGEQVRWETDGDPAHIAAATLLERASRLASAALLAHHWPVEGSRHTASLALAGALLRAGWHEVDVRQFIVDVATAAEDDEAEARGTSAETTATRLRAEGKATGWPGMVAIFGQPVVDKVCEWLGVERQQEAPRVEVPRAAREWPSLADEAYHGLAGDIVRAIEPHTEVDPAGLLFTTIDMFGNIIGHTPHALVSGSRHPCNLFTALVGDSSKARKGSTLGYLKPLFAQVDPGWASDRIVSGLSSGEGLIFAVRDPSDAVGKDGEPIDPGVEDKRLLVIEEELAGPLKAMQREGNTLSVVLRQAWDSGNLRTLTKNSPVRATDGHISLIAHVTTIELQRHLTETACGNGFGNRFSWVCCRRSRELPDGGGSIALETIEKRLKAAVAFAKKCTAPIGRDATARAVWHGVYGPLSEGKPGLLGAMIGRAEALTLRYSVAYALLDRSAVVQVSHLKAALALWDFAQSSARYIFGERLGDPIADSILEALQHAGSAGLSRTDISNLFGRNQIAARIQIAIAQLVDAGLVDMRKSPQESGPGAPATRYYARSPHAGNPFV